MPGVRLPLAEREELALGIASGRRLTGIARKSAVRCRQSRGRSSGTVVVAVTERWSRSVRHAGGRSGPSHVVSWSMVRWLVRSRAVCGCGIP